VWRVLDTGFELPRFLSLWRAWRAQTPAQKPRLLHVVGLCAGAPDLASELATGDDDTQALTQELASHWVGLLPGWHRFVLAQGHLHLTLCIGPWRAQLREQSFAADAMAFDASLDWDATDIKLLGRVRQRGTRLHFSAFAPDQLQAEPWASPLRELGFAPSADAPEHTWVCNPSWNLRARSDAHPAPQVSHAVVVGAGLAGASVAAALARRGWQVTVLDRAPEPAAGASGLPAGLMIPYVAADDGPRSQLTRAGLHLMRQEAERLLQAGSDWGPSGVMELRLEGKAGLPKDWPSQGQALSREMSPIGPASWQQGLGTVPALWHARAAWIKPAQLVRAWLAQEGVRFQGNAAVDRLRAGTQGWDVLDAQGQLLASTPLLVLANALDAARLLQTAALTPPGVHGMRGVLSYGLHTADDAALFPPHPVNGAGSCIPNIPTPQGRTWYVGSTYERLDETAAPTAEHLQADWYKLQRLLPHTAQQLAPAYASGAAQAWESVRCVSRNRLPLVGRLGTEEAPLWISAAMGSRGLSLAMLCAELLAAQIGGEPWPIPAHLARALDARADKAGT
jgi:tRNA 5-methylaminomethyl-2-thiouridine biosynthesis bifunctional protein